MKKLLTVIVLLVLAGGAVWYVTQDTSLQGNESHILSGNTAEISGEYDEKRDFAMPSHLMWEASKVGGTHTGTVELVSGFVLIQDDMIVGADLVVDMTTITVSDLEGGMKESLEKHLKSDDFFAVETYPEVHFVVDSFEAEGTGYMAEGLLTIKGIAKRISFPVAFEKSGDSYHIAADFLIDRTERNIMYGSTKLVDTVKEKALDDSFRLAFDLSL